MINHPLSYNHIIDYHSSMTDDREDIYLVWGVGLHIYSTGRDELTTDLLRGAWQEVL